MPELTRDQKLRFEVLVEFYHEMDMKRQREAGKLTKESAHPIYDEAIAKIMAIFTDDPIVKKVKRKFILGDLVKSYNNYEGIVLHTRINEKGQEIVTYKETVNHWYTHKNTTGQLHHEKASSLKLLKRIDSNDELGHLLMGLWHWGYNLCNQEKNHPDGYDNYTYSIDPKVTQAQIEELFRKKEGKS